ncbi:helix-turn-helix domain-containing protein [Treponema phagedenis]|nr:helix-turn-helix domain-containing protein [Treponema phagedenis]QLC57753.1 helix-turn-helix domain-containing protein [Treponema phagedenis]
MKLFMSIDQITRGHVIANCLEGRCTVQQAALRLNLSRRRVQQLKKAFKEKGLAAMLHGNSQRPSAKKTSKEIEQRLLALRSDPALSNCSCHIRLCAVFCYHMEFVHQRKDEHERRCIKRAIEELASESCCKWTQPRFLGSAGKKNPHYMLLLMMRAE